MTLEYIPGAGMRQKVPLPFVPRMFYLCTARLVPLAVRRRRRPFMALRRLPQTWLRGLAALCGLAVLLLVVWSSSGPNAALWRLLGIGGVPAASLPRTLAIVITPSAPAFGPTAAALAIGGQVTFVNRLNSALVVRSTVL